MHDNRRKWLLLSNIYASITHSGTLNRGTVQRLMKKLRQRFWICLKDTHMSAFSIMKQRQDKTCKNLKCKSCQADSKKYIWQEKRNAYSDSNCTLVYLFITSSVALWGWAVCKARLPSSFKDLIQVKCKSQSILARANIRNWEGGLGRFFFF